MQHVPRLAFDRTASSRRLDADGRLHVIGSRLTRAGVSPYLGREVVGADKLGLDPDRIYMLLRPPEELEKSMPTWNALPVLGQHFPANAEDHRPDLVVGATGTDAAFDDPCVRASLVIWAAPAIRGIESGEASALSGGYRYVPRWGAGEFEGQAYDGRMTNIEGSHVALVATGRVPGAIVGDRQLAPATAAHWRAFAMDGRAKAAASRSGWRALALHMQGVAR